jgi:hypothetical protein
MVRPLGIGAGTASGDPPPVAHCPPAINEAPYPMTSEHRPSWLLQLLGLILARFLIFIPVVAMVWAAYVWLYAEHQETLGWIYTELRPVTIWLYGFVDTSLPEAVRYKVSAGLSDELGPRALLLLILAGVAELIVLFVVHIFRGLFRLGRGRRHEEPSTA